MTTRPLITDRKTALEKGARYCAYQERSQQEVRDKLYTIGVASSLVEEVIAELIQQDFINEERFARAWAGGKFRVKSWGRIKIRRGLQLKRVSDYCIRAGLSEIDEMDYRERLSDLLDEKLGVSSAACKKDPAGAGRSEAAGPKTAGSPTSNAFLLRKKAATYAISRGYEPELVWELLREKI